MWGMGPTSTAVGIVGESTARAQSVADTRKLIDKCQQSLLFYRAIANAKLWDQTENTEPVR